MQRTEGDQRNPLREAADRLAGLIVASASEHAVIAMDRDARVIAWNVGAERLFGWTEAEMLGRSADQIFASEDRAAEEPSLARQTADRLGKAPDRRWRMRKDGSRFRADGVLTPIRGDEIAGYLMILQDTAGQPPEDARRLPPGGTQERLRNIVALIRAIAARTADTADTVEAFASHFDGRLAALARIQNSCARTVNSTVELEEVVREELVATGAVEEQVAIGGPSVRLPQGLAEPLALAVHELAANAVKFGAPASVRGRLSVRWRIESMPQQQRLVLEWREAGVPVLELNPRRGGFGRELIEQDLPVRLGARTSMDFAPGGLRAVLEIPLTELARLDAAPQA